MFHVARFYIYFIDLVDIEVPYLIKTSSLLTFSDTLFDVEMSMSAWPSVLGKVCVRITCFILFSLVKTNKIARIYVTFQQES